MSLATVLLPVYNGQKYIRAAIDSILSQSFRDFDLIILNDCSPDNCEEIILSYKDERIKYIKNAKNLGLAETLNFGINLVETKYIFRMDQDDIALPHRFEKQIDFMESNENVVVCGSNVKRFGDSNGTSNVSLSHAALITELIFRCPILHPTMILRTKVLQDNSCLYSKCHTHAEEWDLALRLSAFGELANLPEVLLNYRTHDENTTVLNISSISKRYICMYKDIFNKIMVDVTDDELEIHSQLVTNYSPSFPIGDYKKWLFSLPNRLKKFDKLTLEQNTEMLWNRFFYKCADKGILELISYIKEVGLKKEYVKYLAGRGKRYFLNEF